MDVTLNDRPMHAPEVVSRVIDGEAVIVHPQQGQVRVLNAVGARLWELMDGQRSLADLAGLIVAEYDVAAGQAQADVASFCADLAGRGLVTIRQP